MSDSSESVPPHGYVAYIDESGDPGIKTVRPLDPEGSSEWLMVSAVVIDARREAEVSTWIGDMTAAVRSHQLRDIHFAKLSPQRKLLVCQHLANLPVRCFVVASNKQNMRGWRNSNAEKIPSDNWFYCWLTRLLLERVTHWVEQRSMLDHGETKLLKLVFSERGGLSYSQMNAYYQWLKSKGDNQFLTKGNLAYSTMDMRLMKVLNHAGHDGLKLPDIVASAFFKAADIHHTRECDPQFAFALKDRMARWPDKKSGLVAGYGVKLMPGYGALRNKVQDRQREIFRLYGYPNEWSSS